MKKILLFSSFLFLVSCATDPAKEVYHEKMQQKSHMSKEQMNDKILSVLGSSKNLTKKQREDFLSLHSSVMQEVVEINNDIRRLKVVLFKSISKGDYERRKIESIKKQIITNYNRKLNLMFDALYKTQKILGVGSSDFYQNEWFPVHFSL